MGNLDSFSMAVLAGAVLVVVVFGVLMLMDKGKPATPSATTSSKVAGKR